MKVGIVYYSRTGNTKRAAEIFEEKLKEKKINVDLIEIESVKRPSYQGDLPEGNNGLGLMLLGVTGDEVLPAAIYQEIKKMTISKVRGTVQADILKEDQAQNTCIFSTEFALKMMGDVQEYFTLNNIRNFYSVSISGYYSITIKDQIIFSGITSFF